MLDTIQQIKLSDASTHEELLSTTRVLLNIVEELYQKNQSLEAENRQLKDEINRLKGEQGVPKFAAKKEKKDYSSKKKI